MGAIQGAINSVLGTAAGAIGTAKVSKASSDAAKSAATRELIDISEAAPKLEEEIKGQEEEVTNKIEDVAKTTQGHQEELNKINEAEAAGFESDEQEAQATARREEINEDIEKRKLALGTAQGKLTAMTMQRDYYKERVAKITGGKR